MLLWFWAPCEETWLCYIDSKHVAPLSSPPVLVWQVYLRIYLPKINIERERGKKSASVSTIMTGIVDGQLGGEQKMAYFCFSFFCLNSSSFFLK